MHQRASKLDLTLTLTETGPGLDGSIEYDTELFDEDRIRRMAGHFLELLHSVVSDPGRVLSRLAWVTAAERRQHLIEWNATRVDHPGAACIHDLIEEQAARVPERMAVASQGVTLTYRELNRRATAAARVLREAGVGPEVLVGVCIERSVELVVALLGILKSGGAYVPLDIRQPKARLDALAHEAGLKHIVVDPHGRRHLEGANEASFVPTELWSSSLEGGCRSEHGPSDPDNLAYTLFTSGTTGKPKGVQVSHRSVVNLLRSMRDRLGVSELDTVLGVTNLSFDIAGLELWLPLILGGKLVLASRQTAADPEALAREILENSVSVVQATPATWGMLRDAGCALSTRVMRLCGGEALPTDLGDYLTADGAAAWNLYGPTETTIWSTASRLESQPRKVVTIGTPIANTRTYVVDSHLEPRPVGLAGELLIGGAGVARGYLNEPGLTAERFIPDPFSAEPGQRLYRTGDIVRHGIDGQIEHLGRSDHQVKIRGFRIEVAEVEAVLLGHPEVKSALVMARTDKPAETKLVAYLVPRGPTTVAGKDLRAWASQKLPDYMVPAHVVWLDAFPVSANGKIDRAALPLPIADHEPAAAPAGAAPRTPLELVVAQAWREALRVDQVTLDDDFFDLGGHSLSATKVVSRLRRSLAREVPIHLLFEFTTLGDFTRHLSSLEPAPTRST